MSIFKKEDIIGWQDKESRFLCPECFDEEYRGNESVDDWDPVNEKEQEEYTFICDNSSCRKRI